MIWGLAFQRALMIFENQLELSKRISKNSNRFMHMMSYVNATKETKSIKILAMLTKNISIFQNVIFL